ncbi:MAG TPA: pantoate--beta-alanine ligase [Acidimicrobiales bacterium]
MRLITTVAEMAQAAEIGRKRGNVGFVPTMGFLHAGHESLIRRAARECDLTAVSIFVNPLQFGAGEDLAAYPRDLDRDLELAERSGAELAFVPPTEEMYPRPMAATVSVQGVGDAWEGESRPTHFAGVATVVAKLFAIVGPSRAYFGDKDFQQLAVIRRMAGDLSLPVEVVGCPTVRDADGLALSSRNIYLSPAERQAAPVLYRALLAGRRRVQEAGERAPAAVEDAMRAVVAAEPLAALDYAAAVGASDLSRPERLSGEVRLLIAARVGPARLIDNLGTLSPNPSATSVT